ncbi:hypothetical protein PPERSA_11662 [Pseudocohnilembus persalinus]|uniref:Transmembrane protein n=1 Tax=Pseudocohnilembus persalinus TaxID=266149 RepID=A0A0V0QA43_PSEPJ|nr:hypothetical protein PPERSA_11662 [Pseudocohnilembus persalinus]|eukprot:KRW99061.1 hypothetical protein PPERSA_11662 [Pseudocohnilembus persalinus]
MKMENCYAKPQHHWNTTPGFSCVKIANFTSILDLTEVLEESPRKSLYEMKKFQKSKTLFEDIFWDGHNPQPDTQHSLFISKEMLRKIRIILAIYAFSIISCEVLEEDNPIVNFQFLTFYGELMTFIYFFLVAVNKWWKLAHIIFEINFSLQITVCLMYWIAVYPTQNHDGSLYFFFKTSSAHGGMFLAMWIDNYFNMIRFYKRHLTFICIFVLAYLSLNIAVTFSFEPVYPPITWVSVECYIFIFLGVMMGIFHYFFGSLYYNLVKKPKFHRQLRRNQQQIQQQNTFNKEIQNAHKQRRVF